MSMFISDFLRKEDNKQREIYIYPIYDNYTFQSIKVYDFNWKRKTKEYLQKNEIIGVVIVYRVSENIVSERFISKYKDINQMMVENAIFLNGMVSLIDLIKK